MFESILNRRISAVAGAALWAICSMSAQAVPLETLSNYATDIKIGEGVVFSDGSTSSFNDWSGVTAYQNNTNPNALVQSIAIANDSQYYYFKYTFNGNYDINALLADKTTPSPLRVALNLYVDMDSSHATGTETWWGSDALGIDLLVQGATVFPNWPDLSTSVALGMGDNALFPFASANGMEFKLSRDVVMKTDSFNFQFVEQDIAYNIADIYPYCRAGTGGDSGTPCVTTTDPLVEWPGIQPYFRYVAADAPATSVPEPGSLGLLGITLVVIGVSVARRRWTSNPAA